MLKLNTYSTEKLLELLKDSCVKESFNWTQRRIYYPDQDDEYVKSTERDEIVAYIMEICDREDMAFNIETFALCVSLLDRFLASYKVKSKFLECLAIACLYIACKIKEEDEMISITSEFLLDCGCKCSVSELLRMEQMVLTKFEWSVNDTTPVDFLHIFYALLVNKYNKIDMQSSQISLSNIWSLRNNLLQNKQQPQNVYKNMSPPPCDLDFLHTLEYKLKHCLSNHELVSQFKPHVLAYSLLSIQMDKTLETISKNKSMCSAMNQTMDLISLMCKLNDQQIEQCKSQLKYHLQTIENTKSLFDRYFNQSTSNIRIRNYRSLFVSSLPVPLSAIKEEDEEEYMMDEDEEEYADNHHLSHLNMQQKEHQAFLSYADILAGRQDQKRKLSENSDGSASSEVKMIF